MRRDQETSGVLKRVDVQQLSAVVTRTVVVEHFDYARGLVATQRIDEIEIIGDVTVVVVRQAVNDSSVFRINMKKTVAPVQHVAKHSSRTATRNDDVIVAHLRCTCNDVCHVLRS